MCGQPTPMELGQAHHVIPQAVGARPDNSQDNTKILDASCHHNLHRIAEKLMKGKSGLAKDLADRYYPSTRAVKRILELAHIVAREMVEAREGNRPLPEMVVVSFEIPRTVYNRLRIMGAARNGGKPGMAPLLRQLVTDITRQHFEGGDSDEEPQIMVRRTY